MPPEINTNTSYKEAISQIFGRPPIYDVIFSCLTPLALIRMASTSRAIRFATEDFTRRAYNINKRLKRYFNDPQSFRSLMARTDMVISGSFALQFFDRSFYPESDLDLYVYNNEKLRDIASHLLKEGYAFKPVGEQIDDPSKEIEYMLTYGTRNEDDYFEEADDTIDGVLNFARTPRGTSGDVRKVQVIVTHESPIDLILAGFHSTCVMNIITHDTACSLYPDATFERRETLIVNNPRKAEDALAKYAARGWKLCAFNHPWWARPGPEFASFFEGIVREPSDEMAWTISLDADGVAWPTSLDPGLPSTSLHWSHLVDRCCWTLRANDGTPAIKCDLTKTYKSRLVEATWEDEYGAEYLAELWGDGGPNGYFTDVLNNFRPINVQN